MVTRNHDLILWSCHHTSRFPRTHCFVLGERIERNLYDLLETLLTARYTRNRQALLEQANLTLEILRFRVWLARDLHCLKTDSYAFAAVSVQGSGFGLLSRLGGPWLVRQPEPGLARPAGG